jgi:hypothetical protein
MTTLISSSAYLQVRKARSNKTCYARHKFWASPQCTGIRKGSTYVAKVAFRFVGGKFRWDHDVAKYCAHCALVAFPSIKVGEEKAA